MCWLVKFWQRSSFPPNVFFCIHPCMHNILDSIHHITYMHYMDIQDGLIDTTATCPVPVEIQCVHKQKWLAYISCISRILARKQY